MRDAATLRRQSQRRLAHVHLSDDFGLGRVREIDGGIRAGEITPVVKREAIGREVRIVAFQRLRHHDATVITGGQDTAELHFRIPAIG